MELGLKRFILLIVCLVLSIHPAKASEGGGEGVPIDGIDTKSESLFIYFPDASALRLVAQERKLPKGISMDDPYRLGRYLVKELLAGPKGRGVKVLPENSALGAFFIDNEKTAYVDIDISKAGPLRYGVRQEILSVYALVNTLVINADGIEKVKILFNGKEADTFAGHVDISSPLKADLMWTR